MNKYDYALEKFEDARQILAVWEGDVRSRLGTAYSCLIVISSAPEEYLPEELVEDFQWVKNQITKYSEPPHPLGHEWQKGDVLYTLSRIYNKTAARIAERIWDIWAKLRLYYQN
jgi:hypothetical protein